MLKIQIMNMTMIHMITRTLKKESYYMKGFMPILLLVLFFVNEVQSQNNFGTSNGIIVFTAMIDNQPVKYVSNELDVTLNYETAEIEFELEKNDIRTESQFLLQFFNPELLRFDGKLGINYIRTESHPVQNFTVEGTLKSSTSDPYQIHGKGTLIHLYHKNGISCLLNISFHLAQDDVKRILMSAPQIEIIHMELVQTIMDKQGH